MFFFQHLALVLLSLSWVWLFSWIFDLILLDISFSKNSIVFYSNSLIPLFHLKIPQLFPSDFWHPIPLLMSWFGFLILLFLIFEFYLFDATFRVLFPDLLSSISSFVYPYENFILWCWYLLMFTGSILINYLF